MEKHLKEIHDSINNLLLYSDDNVKKYISLLNEAIIIIENLETQENSVSETWKNKALIEISNELANRVNDKFFSADPERKKYEFKFSKVVVSMAITNILMNA